MKTNRFLRLIQAALVLALWPIAGYAENAKSSGAILPPSNAVVTITVTAAEPPATVLFAATAVSPVAPTRWIDIKDYPSEMRNLFFAGLTRLETMLNVQISELTALRAAMTDASSTTDLDLTLQEMRNARFSLKLTVEKLTKATAQTWDHHKSMVGLAWGKSQAAYTKFKARTIL